MILSDDHIWVLNGRSMKCIKCRSLRNVKNYSHKKKPFPMRISVLFYFVISSIICESRSDSLTEFFQWDFSGHWSGNRFTLKIFICMILKDWFKVECSCTFRRHELGQYSAGFWFGRQRSKRSFSTDDDIYRFRYSPRAPIFPPVQVIAITTVRNGMDRLTFQRKLHV